MAKKQRVKSAAAPLAADSPAAVETARLMTLALDIVGTGTKATVLDPAGKMVHERVRIHTPVDGTPDAFVVAVVAMVKDLPPFDRISVGYPGAVRQGRVLTAPHFTDKAWIDFDLAGALGRTFGKPIRVSNDADIQGLGAISGHGIEFILTLGTGAGTAAFRDGDIGPHLEFAHHPVHGKKTYNDYIGNAALKKIGRKAWTKRVHKVIAILNSLVNYDRLYIGGGNASFIEGDLPADITIVSNDTGMTGGIALWTRDSAPQ